MKRVMAACCGVGALVLGVVSLEAATISPGGSGTLGTVNYISGNLALGTTVAARGGATTSSIDGQPGGETFGTVTGGGNDSAGMGAGFASGHSWHRDAQSGTPVDPSFFRVNFGNIAGQPNSPNHEYAVSTITLHPRADCCNTQVDQSGAVPPDTARVHLRNLAGSIVSTSNPVPQQGGSQSFGFTGLGSIARSVDYREMESFNELQVSGMSTLSMTAADVLDIDMSVAGNDFINVEGAAALNGTLDISFLGGFSPAMLSTFDILSASSITGSLTLTGDVDAFVQRIITSGGRQTLQLVSAPEPSSIAVWGALAGVAAVGALVLRRRRRT